MCGSLVCMGFTCVRACVGEGGLVCMFAQSVSVPQAMSPCGES